MPGVNIVKLGCTLLFLSAFNQAWPESSFAQELRPLSVYVAPFWSEQPTAVGLLESTTDDFDEFLTNSRKYKVLERRIFKHFTDQLRNESDFANHADLVKKFQENGAQAIFFGRVRHDAEDLSYVFSVNLVSISGEKIWSTSSSLKQSLIGDRESRRNAIQKLLPDYAVEDRGSISARNLQSSPKVSDQNSNVRQMSTNQDPVAMDSEMGFDFSLEKCAKQSGDKVECVFRITNRTGDRALTMFATTSNRGSTLCIDDDGVQTTAASVSLGSFPSNLSVQTTAFSNVAIRSVVTFSGVRQNVNKLSLLSLKFLAKAPGQGTFPSVFPVNFRNVNIESH